MALRYQNPLGTQCLLSIKASLKVKPEADEQGPFSRQFEVKVQRVQPVVLVREIEKAQRQFGMAPWKAIPT